MPSADYLTAGLLGIVEGLTEFLPVSSTGHLILADALLGIEGPASKLFDIVIQLGAILAVCWVYRERFTDAPPGSTSIRSAQRFVANIVIAFLPAAVVGVFAHRLIKEVLFSPWVVAVSLIVGGILILVIERVRPQPRIVDVDEMRMRTALGIGCCQILAMIPGVSRAGATIMGGADARRRPRRGDPVLVFSRGADDARRGGLRSLQEPRHPVGRERRRSSRSGSSSRFSARCSSCAPWSALSAATASASSPGTASRSAAVALLLLVMLR